MNSLSAGLAAECDSRERIHRKVYEKKLNNGKNDLLAQQRTNEASQDCCDVYGKLENQELANGLEHCTTIQDSLFNGCKVVVQNSDISGNP